jgi:hypothetical protein
MMITRQIVYTGFLQEFEYGEGYGLFIGDSPEPVASYLQSEIAGKFVNVQYWISTKELSKTELKAELVKKVYGEADVEYVQQYSDFTGYLWTDENIKIGGHDLLKELKGFEGSYIHLEILVHDV